jgi:hypothetical protein
MSMKSKQSISDLPGQVREEDAAHMAGAGKSQQGEPTGSIIIDVEGSNEQSKDSHDAAKLKAQAVQAAADDKIKAVRAEAEENIKKAQAAGDAKIKALEPALALAQDKVNFIQALQDKIKAGKADTDRTKSEPALKVSGDLPAADRDRAKSEPAPPHVKPSDPDPPGAWGELKNEIGKKGGGEVVKAVTQVAVGAAIESDKNAAKVAGAYHEVGSSQKVGPDKTTQQNGDTTTDTSSGTYKTVTGKAAVYTVDTNTLKAAGAGAEFDFKKGWQSKTTVTVDRYGAKSSVTEIWADAKIAASGSASADANTRGMAVVDASIRVSVSAEHGIQVTVTDKTTGASWTKSGVLKAEASGDAGVNGTIAWTGAMGRIGGAVGAALSATGSVATSDGAGNTIGAGLTGKLGASATGVGQAGLTFNPVEGYGFKRGVDWGVALGGSIGGTTKIETDVTKVQAAADAVFGHLSTKFRMDGGYKDGKIQLKLELGAALGIGFNAKIDTEIDLQRWGENIGYRVDKQIKEVAEGSLWDKVWAANKIMNPYLRAYEVFGIVFGESKPPPETLKIWWDPTNKSKGEIARHFVEEIEQFAKVRANNLMSEMHKNSLRNADKDYDLQFRWEDRSTLDYLTFDHPKNLSDRIAKEFGESQDERIKDLELTFKHRLPDYMSTFQADTYAIFGGKLSLVQYMSIQEYKRVEKMDKDTAENYLRTNTALSEHLPEEAKAKLWAFWQSIQEQKERDLKADPPPYRANEPSERYENDLWWQAKNAVKNGTPEGKRITEIDQYARAMSNAYGCKDDTLAPRTVIGSAELYKWTSVPRGEDGRHLIDLTEVKQGKIGLKDLLYQNEEKVLSKLGSPQAVYQYMTSAESSHIAEGSKGHFMQEWMSKNGHAAWRYGSDEASTKAQAWWAKNEANYWKMVDTKQHWANPTAAAPKTDFKW